MGVGCEDLIVWITGPNASSLNGTCPFGKKLPGDVTMPDDASVFQMICLAYGFVPYVVVLLAGFDWLVCKRGTRGLSFLFFVGALVAVQELFVKRLPFLREARPGASWLLTDESGRLVGSCNHSCGMPSSHAAMSIGFLCLLIFDGIFRVVPSKEELNDITDFDQFAFTLTPLLPMRTTTHKQFLSFVVVWIMILLPVPISRVVLYDHTAKQVSVGSFEGLILASLWYALMHWLQYKYHDKVGKTFCCGLFKHDYAPPHFHVIIDDDGFLEVTAEDGLSEEDESDEAVEFEKS